MPKQKLAVPLVTTQGLNGVSTTSRVLAATGHRPDKLGGYGDDVSRRLQRLAFGYLQQERPERVIVGMALGWDQAVAEAALELGIPFTAAIPFEGQERRWPPESRGRYARLIEHAAAVEIVCDYPGAKAMQRRNEWMVDRADKILALWDGSWGGTFNCVQYARRVGRPIDNLWRAWSMELSDLLA